MQHSWPSTTTMCDLFWLSAAGEQGDLSDVVRASLQQQPPHHHLPITPSYLQPGEGGGGGLQQVATHPRDDQLGMTTMSSDHHVSLHSPSTTTHPQPQPLAAGMIGQMSMPPAPQRLGLGDKEGDVVAGGDHLQQMSMAHHPHHVPAINKRRKSQTKKVVCIPAPTAASGRPSTSGEVVPSDLWAWRKYGQKPIKGSPYPRGYYRCSSSKGCPARKQVERSRTDPNMLVITYTSDHNHPWPTQRNALAGSTRPSSSSSSTAAAAKNTSSFAAAHSSNNTNDDSGAGCAHHQLKQEADLDLFADMDALNIFSSNTNIQQLEDDSKQQLFDDPFTSATFFDYWASFGEADK